MLGFQNQICQLSFLREDILLWAICPPFSTFILPVGGHGRIKKIKRNLLTDFSFKSA